MKRIIIVAAYVLAALSAESCLVRINEKVIRSEMHDVVKANGDLVTQTRRLDGDVRVYQLLGSNDFVFVQHDTEPYLEITAYENIMPYLNTELSEDGRLTCRFTSTSNISTGYVKIVLYAPDLEEVNLVGSGDCLIEGLVRQGDFSVSVAGSGDIHLKGLECDNLKVGIAGSGDAEIGVVAQGSVEASIAGSGDIRLIGSADRASFSVAGSGDIDARGLKIANGVSTSSKGSGDIRL